MVDILYPPGPINFIFLMAERTLAWQLSVLEHKSRVIQHFLCKCCKSPTNGVFSPLMDEVRGSVDCQRNRSSGWRLWRARQLRERHNFSPLLRSLFAHKVKKTRRYKRLINKGQQHQTYRAAHDK